MAIVSGKQIDGVVTTDDAGVAFISSSMAVSGFGSQVSYVSSSLLRLEEIEVADFDNNVAVTFVDGRLKFIFGTPSVPSLPVLSFNGTYETDRFNKIIDDYVITGTFSVNGYTLVSASLYEGDVLLNQVGGTANEIMYSVSDSGSHTYRLEVTASSPLDNSINTQSTTLIGTLQKTGPESPVLYFNNDVELGTSSNQIEAGAVGSLIFTSSSVSISNDWLLNYTSTNEASPLELVQTDINPITVLATAYYYSTIGDNDPDLTTTKTTSRTFNRIRSLRFGASDQSSFIESELLDLSSWDTSLGGSVGTIRKGVVSVSGQVCEITWIGDKFHYIVYSASLPNLSSITADGFNVLSAFSVNVIGNYKVYRTNTLQSGYGGTTITYTLTI